MNIHVLQFTWGVMNRLHVPGSAVDCIVVVVHPQVVPALLCPYSYACMHKHL